MTSHDDRRRRNPRLREWDYGVGAYFITICTHEKHCYFGEVRDGIVALSQAGTIVKNIWKSTFPDGSACDVVVMPNHLHGIVWVGGDKGVQDKEGSMNRAPTSGEERMGHLVRQTRLGAFIRKYKARCAREIHKAGFKDFAWQRNFHERIVRDERMLEAFREYIRDNPIKWDLDDENPYKNKNCA